MSYNTKPSVESLQRTSKTVESLQRTSNRKRTVPKKYRDLTPDGLNPKEAMTNPYEKEPTERFRPSEHTTVMNPYQKTAPPQSQSFSETEPQSLSVSSFKCTTTNPYTTPCKTTPPQSQPFSGTKP